MGSFAFAIATIAPIALAAPCISIFISPIPPAGFIEIPPVSNVMPLPTITNGLSVDLPPLYSMTINTGGLTLP